MSTDQRSIDWYNQNADNYTNHVRDPQDSIYHSLYEKPAMYKLLPDLQGKSVLSLGCGSGEDCHHLAQQGAARVTGVDISENMIAIAQQSYPEHNFQVMDMEHLIFEPESFDFAYSSLAIHYIDDWSKVLAEAYRVLKPGSFFLFSCNHPVYSALHKTENSDAMKKKELSRTIDKATNKAVIVGDYMKRQPIVVQGELAVTTWHKAIGEISTEIAQTGFLIANIIEPQALQEMAEISLKDYETLQKIPNFIIFKLFKN